MLHRQKFLLLFAALAFGAMGVPARAEDIPQGQIDALALMAMAPQMCGIDTEARWKATMTSVSEQYGQPIGKLTADVKQAMGELARDLRNKPDMVKSQCALLK